MSARGPASSRAANKGRARTWLVRYPRAIPAALFLAIAAITAVSVYAIETNAEQRARAEVRDFAQSISSALDRRGNNFSSYLRAGAALFATIDEVKAQTFGQFIAELRLDQNYRGAEGIGWLEVIENQNTDAFLRQARSAQPDYPDIWPASLNSEQPKAPVTYLFPDTGRNRLALGFDMYSEPVRAAAMDKAKLSAMPTASGKILLAQDARGETPGFAIFMPVYKEASGAQSQSRALTGYVYSSFDAAQFLEGAIERAPPTDLGVRLYDRGAAPENLLASRSLGSAGTDRFEQPVSIANRDFVLVVDSARPAALDPLSMVTLIAGLALASLLMLILRMLANQAIEDEARLVFYEEQQSIRNSLSRELNHRVKNTLANVLSILSLTRRRSKDMDGFADSLEGRIRALSATHDLLTESDWGTTAIADVVHAEMQHFVEPDGARLVVEGPPVELAPNDALSLGLAIHELATNAAKFGALSVAGGKVSVRWRLQTDALAVVEWSEAGGPPVEQLRERGFGTELIEKIVAHELKHRVELDFRPEGVYCLLGVPIRRRSEFQIRATPN